MYSSASSECLKNAFQLLSDSKFLLDKGSYGSARSLSILSLEEGCKAALLELANLEVIEKSILKSMTDHRVKRVVIHGLTSGTFIRKKLIGDNKEYLIKSVEEALDLEKKYSKFNYDQMRNNGFYVDFDVNNVG